MVGMTALESSLFIPIDVLLHPAYVGRDSAAGVATRYELDGPGIESLVGRHFPHPSILAPPPSSLLYNAHLVSFPVVKRPGRGVDLPPSI